MRSAVTFLFVLALFGCSSVAPPQVDILGASVGEVTEEGFVVDFTVNLSNPNDKPLALSEMHYSVGAGGTRVYEGRRSAEATLAAGGQKVLHVPAVILFEQIGTDAVPPSLAYDLRGELWYLAPGALAETLFDAGVQKPSVGFGGEGALTFADSAADSDN